MSESGDTSVFHTLSYPDLEAQVLSTLQEGDTVYLKGSRGMALERLIKKLKESA